MVMIMQPTTREYAFGDEEFQFLARLANQYTGIVLQEHKRDMVYGRLTRRLRALDLPGFAEYCDLLQSDAGQAEMSEFVNAITTNLTSFFRESHHFEHLADHVVKMLVQSGTQRRLRIWSAACSAGMEPYSIAMTIKSAIPNISNWDVKVLATDIDSNMVETARAGEYPANEYEKIPAAYRGYMQQGRNGKMVVKDEIKQLITFKQLNLLHSWPMKGQFDAVFCRNVVIYFDKDTKISLFDRMANVIKPQGWLYIGHSENLHNISDRFELIGRTVYKRVK